MKLPPRTHRERPSASVWTVFRSRRPTWGYADTGTRFGKFLQDAAAITIDEKLADAAAVNGVTGCCPRVAVHVLWDFPQGTDATMVAARAKSLGLRIGSINPNVFQDQCYKRRLCRQSRPLDPPAGHRPHLGQRSVG